MIPFITENEHYEYWANYYAGASYELECSATVHVEAFDDAVFWENTFNHYLPAKRFNFIWASNSVSNNETSGSAQCLKFSNFLSERFLICIDSDYRYILQDMNINPTKHIFQTYTYSIENHLCYKSKLNTLSAKCTGIENIFFDFEYFLLQYSKVVYDTFIWHLHFLQSGDTNTFSKDSFNEIIHLQQVILNSDIDNNGKAILDELNIRCNNKTNALKIQFPHRNIEATKQHFIKLGLTSNNTYLFVRGHNLFDLIVEIGNNVNNKLLKEEKQRLEGKNTAISLLFNRTRPFKLELESSIVFEVYDEIERIGIEIKNYFK